MTDSIFNDLEIAASIQWPEPARNMQDLHDAELQLHNEPVLNLRQALAQMHLIDADDLDRLQREKPELLRNRSSELVNHFSVTQEDLQHALSRMAGLAEVDAREFDIAADAFHVLSLKLAISHSILPLGGLGSRFIVACSHPTNEGLQNYLCFMTGRVIRLVWAGKADIDARLLHESRNPAHQTSELMEAADEAHEASGFPASTPTQDSTPEDEWTLEGVVSQAIQEVASRNDLTEAMTAGESAGVVRLVKMIIRTARDSGASDIHIETNPANKATRVRIRKDGLLHTFLELPAKLRQALILRIKVLARMDISEKRRPQDGKINFSDFGVGKAELRVAVIPTHDGLEDVVLRVLATQKPQPLRTLGLQERDVATLSRLAKHTYGLILAAGPTGSGKTTTLHSILADINDDTRKFWTAEDPIEITQPGLRQVQVNPKVGLTFAAAMRSFLRADPDVIMVGEIRDNETAHIAVEASLTGHLVLSTLHTNTAAESMIRLLDLGVSPLHFSDSLLGIVAQRLVRALCKHCAKAHQLGPGHFEKLVQEYIHDSPLSAEQGMRRLLQAADADAPEKLVVRAPVGCQLCEGTGYRGRTGIYEILEASPEIRALLLARAGPVEIFTKAVQQGMRSLRHDALEKFVQGKVDIKQARMAYL